MPETEPEPHLESEVDMAEETVTTDAEVDPVHIRVRKTFLLAFLRRSCFRSMAEHCPEEVVVKGKRNEKECYLNHRCDYFGLGRKTVWGRGEIKRGVNRSSLAIGKK